MATSAAVHFRVVDVLLGSVAGTGLPMVEVSGLTIVLPDPLGQQACSGAALPCVPALYAATHGRSGYVMLLP